jgi:hypothetical protein
MLLFPAGCGRDDKTDVVVSETAVEIVRIAPARVEGPYRSDGSLRPSTERVFGAPAPQDLAVVDGDKGAAAYASPHSYRDLVAFYDSELDESWTKEQGLGGAKFSSKKARIYVQKPRGAGGSPRVFYFGDGDNLTPPPRFGQPRRGTAPAPSGATPPVGDDPAPLYDSRPGKRDGRPVTIYTPRNPSDSKPRGDDLTRYEQPPGYDPFAGESVHIPVPEGVLH